MPDEPTIQERIEALRQFTREYTTKRADEMFNHLTAIEAELTRKDELIETLCNEAQFHAGEARGANKSLNEIYQLISGATGEKANWNGAQPVREYIAHKDAVIYAMAEEQDKCVACACIPINCEGVGCPTIDDVITHFEEKVK